MSAPIAVVLLNMGGPDSLEMVEPFLFNLLRDGELVPLPLGFLWQRLFARLVSRRRAKVVRDYYAQIGGKSPLGEITRAQADALETRLNAARPGTFRCHVAMRYTPPFAEEVARAIAADKAEAVVALSLYPHYTTATTGSSLNDLRRALRKADPKLPSSLVEIDRWPEEPLYLDAVAGNLRRGLERFAPGSDVEILFSAHGLPMSFIHKGDPYVEHLKATIAGVMARVGERPWRLTFQSKVGRQKWLEPQTDATLRELAAAGKKQVLVVPIAFVSDHIETLYEIDLLFGNEARELGLDFQRAPSLNTDPTFIEALAALVESSLASRDAGGKAA
jgi:protoporphyrin/coproporphyrin ferrochelatase